MNQVVKFTAYLAERERINGRFASDELLDLFAARRVRTSILLRGIASFGPRNIMRTDESLSLSEDLPVTIAAVDVPEVIGPLVEEASALVNRGLLTLERARLVDTALRVDHDDSVRLTVYLGRQQRVTGRPGYLAVCDILHRSGFTGAISYLGVDGTVAGQRRRAHFFSRNRDVPMMVLGVGTSEQAAAAAAELNRLLPGMFITAERIRVCKKSGRRVADLPTLPPRDADGLDLAQKIMVFTDEDSQDSRHGGHPVHRALVRRLRESAHTAGATVLRGFWGFTSGQQPHGDRMLQLGRHVPVATIIVDTPQAIAASFDIIDDLTAEHGLVTSEMVPAALMLDGRDRRGGTRLARHHY